MLLILIISVKLSILKNKKNYELLLNEKFTKPIGFNTRNTYLQKELPKCETVCYFIFNYLSVEQNTSPKVVTIVFHYIT
jgi:hypothetical protein